MTSFLYVKFSLAFGQNCPRVKLSMRVINLLINQEGFPCTISQTCPGAICLEGSTCNAPHSRREPMAWANWITNITIHYAGLALVMGIGVFVIAVIAIGMLALQKRRRSRK